MDKVCCNPSHTTKTPAVLYCRKCERCYCAECQASLHSTLFSDHKDYITYDINSTDLFSGRCEKHKEYLLDFVCKTHSCMCCAMCVLKGGDHHNCTTVRISEISLDEVRKRISQIKKTIEARVSNADRFMKNVLEKKRQDFEQALSATKSKIKATFSELREAINTREAELLKMADEALEANNIYNTISLFNDTSKDEETIEHLKKAEEAIGILTAREVISKACGATDIEKEYYDRAGEAFCAACTEAKVGVFFTDSLLQKIKSFGDVKVSKVSSSLFLYQGKVTRDAVTLTWNPVPLSGTIYRVTICGGQLKEPLNVFVGKETTFVAGGLEPSTIYTFSVRPYVHGVWGYPSNEVCVVTENGHKKQINSWKKCKSHIDGHSTYSVREKDGKAATSLSDGYCTIIGNSSLPHNKVTSWSIKILKSRDNDGGGIFIGVAPFDIDQNKDDNYEKCGWYINCYSSALWSGPPHNYFGKKYGPRKERGGWYVHTGDIVGVVMNTTSGKLSFAVSGVYLGVAFDGIPLDKPLVPCVLLYYKNDSLELID